jgi:hypothetical protein
MSMVCEGCGDTITAPEPAWYAGTGHSYTVSFLCHTCVSLIPSINRTMTAALQPFDLSFGHLIAPLGSYNRCQCVGSRQDRVVFSTDADTIRKTIPFSDRLLDALYPFYCIQEYLDEIMTEYKAAKHTEPGAWHRLMQDIQKYGIAIADWLHVPHAATIDRIEIEKTGNLSLVTQNKLSAAEMKAVLKALIKKYGV